MKNAEFSIVIGDGKIIIRISGKINETTEFPEVDFGSSNEIIFEVGELAGINSIGIRSWILWNKKSLQGKSVIYRNCTPAVIEQIQAFVGFIPEGAIIESVNVPYYCESCNKITSLVVVRPNSLTGMKVDIADSVPCQSCNQTIQIDVEKSEYIEVLENKK